MKDRLVGIAFVALTACWSPARADGVAAASLQRHVDHLVREAGQRGAEVSVAVADLNSDLTAGANARTPLVPASIHKQWVMAAAIDRLGPTFAFRTVLGLLGRDLVVVGDGDPAIGDPRLCRAASEEVTAVFDRWSSALQDAGIRSITGDLVIDDSIFDAERVHPAWETGDLQKWYAAPVGGLNLADNCIELTAYPSSDGSVAWQVEPPAGIVEIDNRARAASKGVPVIGRRGDTFTYLLSGVCGSRSTLQPVAVPEPGIFFAHALRAALHRNGITVHGDVRRARVRSHDGTLPTGFHAIAEHRTGLTKVVARIGKNSQNLFAECLLKRLGYDHARQRGDALPVGSWKTGREAILAFLNETGVNVTGLVIADGSGLSRDNRGSAAQFVDLLRSMDRHAHHDLFVDSLAVAGTDGSLRSRMRDLSGAVVAKTGTMSGIRALSGYIRSRDRSTFAFCVIFNDIRGSSAPFKKLQDDLCRTLAGAATAESP